MQETQQYPCGVCGQRPCACTTFAYQPQLKKDFRPHFVSAEDGRIKDLETRVCWIEAQLKKITAALEDLVVIVGHMELKVE